MRLTKNVLKQFLDNQSKISRLQGQNDKIRDAILKLGRNTHRIGPYCVFVTRFTRTIPDTVERIREEFGAQARRILKTISGDRVQIKKVD